MKIVLYSLLLIIYSIRLEAQVNRDLSGKIEDSETGQPLAGIVVTINNSGTSVITDNNGIFRFTNIIKDKCIVKINVLGYNIFVQNVDLTKERHLPIRLKKSPVKLDEVTVSHETENNVPTLNSRQVGKSYFFENQESSFAKTLSKIPGISSMDIGASTSKPIIRGLGFNRITVVDKGISQQDQQWGADHGLEIDQYDIENVVVYKGPMSLQLGSDAIGGAIEILSPKTPNEDIYWGDVTLTGKSNNGLLGLSIANVLKKHNWFVKIRYTGQRYSDYRVPADRFNYMTFDFPIYKNRLKNTAGAENNISGLLRYSNEKIEADISVSNLYEKYGFFAGAHGIPTELNLQHDGSFRNIGYPRTNVNHFKTIGNLSVNTTPGKLLFSLGYQDNHRQEWSYFHTHYANQLPPEKDPDLELDFNLRTYTFNTKLVTNNVNNWSHTIGIQSEIQNNRIKGYNFLLPRFNQLSAGTYWIVNHKPSEHLVLNGGLRFDYGKIDITGFYDEILAGYLTNEGYIEEEVRDNAQRAYSLNKNFNNFSGSVGMTYQSSESHILKMNIGNSFRYPKANELASNGMHHGAFRHEQGNPNLKPEKGYQIDLGYNYKQGKFNMALSPFATYFTNYIFLAPQGVWSILPHAGQLYRYQEAKALFIGGEYDLSIDLTEQLTVSTTGEYVYNRNITDKSALPFTPPFSMRNEISYSGHYKIFKLYKVSIQHQLFASQNRIANNEEKTPGTNLFNIAASSNIKIDKFRVNIGLQLQNVFDTKYLNHLSFYRKLNIPEPGRNFQLLIKIPFYKL